jgi:membrane protease YdiL (CAAX protease family)
MGTAMPSLVALGLAAMRGEARNLLAGLMRWRVRARWYAFALAGPPLIMVASTMLHVALGGAWPDYPEAGRWPLVAINFVAVLFLGGPLGEELGWRGYTLPRLYPTLGVTGAGILIGVIWAAWHLPLFLLPSSPQAHLPVLWFFLQAVALSMILSLLWQRTGRSLLLPVLLHASMNSFAGPLRILPQQADGLRPYVLTVCLTWALALLLAATGRQTGRRAASARPHLQGSFASRPLQAPAAACRRG